jgi:hypothetical protein
VSQTETPQARTNAKMLQSSLVIAFSRPNREPLVKDELTRLGRHSTAEFSHADPLLGPSNVPKIAIATVRFIGPKNPVRGKHS